MEPFAECEKDQRPKQQHARQGDDVIRFRLHNLDKLNTILPPALNQEFRSKSLPVVRQKKLLSNPPRSRDYPRIATRPLELPTFRTAPVDSTFVGQTAYGNAIVALIDGSHYSSRRENRNCSL